MPRNMFLFNNAIYLLPYTGVGSGITRALDEDINVTFMNNDKAQEFIITVWRGESNLVEDSDTRLRYSGTDLDTSENNLDTQLRHSDTPKVSLSNKQRDIVNFCSVPRTAKSKPRTAIVSIPTSEDTRTIVAPIFWTRCRRS